MKNMTVKNQINDITNTKNYIIQLFNDFISLSKSSEDYFPRGDFPHLNINTIPKIKKHPKKLQIIQAKLINILCKDTHLKLTDLTENIEKKYQLMAYQAAVYEALNKTGEGEELVGALLIHLMENLKKDKNKYASIIKSFERREMYYEIWETNYAYIAVVFKNNDELILDPFLKIHADSNDEYQSNSELATYFGNIILQQERQSKKFVKHTLIISEYYFSTFNEFFPELKEQINELKTLLIKNCKEQIDKINIIKNASDENLPQLAFWFSQLIKNKVQKKITGENLNKLEECLSDPFFSSYSDINNNNATMPSM